MARHPPLVLVGWVLAQGTDNLRVDLEPSAALNERTADPVGVDTDPGRVVIPDEAGDESLLQQDEGPSIMQKNQEGISKARSMLNAYNRDTNNKIYEVESTANSAGNLYPKMRSVNYRIPDMQAARSKNEANLEQAKMVTPVIEEDAAVPLKEKAVLSTKHSKETEKMIESIEKDYKKRSSDIASKDWENEWLVADGVAKYNSAVVYAFGQFFEQKAMDYMAVVNQNAAAAIRKDEIEYKKKTQKHAIAVDKTMKKLEAEMQNLEMIAEDGSTHADTWAEGLENIVESTDVAKPGLEYQREASEEHLEEKAEEGEEAVDYMAENAEYLDEDLRDALAEEHETTGDAIREKLDGSIEETEKHRDDTKVAIDLMAGQLSGDFVALDKQVDKLQGDLEDIDKGVGETQSKIDKKRTEIDQEIKNYYTDIRKSVKDARAMTREKTDKTEKRLLQELERVEDRVYTGMRSQIGASEEQSFGRVSAARDVLNNKFVEFESKLKQEDASIKKGNKDNDNVARMSRNAGRIVKAISNMKVPMATGVSESELALTKSAGMMAQADEKSKLAISMGLMDTNGAIAADTQAITTFITSAKEQLAKDIAAGEKKQLDDMDSYMREAIAHEQRIDAGQTTDMAILKEHKDLGSHKKESLQMLKNYAATGAGVIKDELMTLKDNVDQIMDAETEQKTREELQAGADLGGVYISDTQTKIAKTLATMNTQTKNAFEDIEAGVSGSEADVVEAKKHVQQLLAALQQKITATTEYMNKVEEELKDDRGATDSGIEDSAKTTRSVIANMKQIWDQFRAKVVEAAEGIKLQGQQGMKDGVDEYNQKLDKVIAQISNAAFTASNVIKKVKTDDKMAFSSALKKAQRLVVAATEQVAKLEELSQQNGGKEAVASVLQAMQNEKQAQVEMEKAAVKASKAYEGYTNDLDSQFETAQGMSASHLKHLVSVVDTAMHGAQADQEAAKAKLRDFLNAGSNNIKRATDEQMRALSASQGDMARKEHTIDADAQVAKAALDNEMRVMSDTYTGDKVKLVHQMAQMLAEAKRVADEDERVNSDIARAKADSEREASAEDQKIMAELAKLDPSAQVSRINGVAKMIAQQEADEENQVAAAANDMESKAFQVNEMVAGIIRDDSEQVSKLEKPLELAKDRVMEHMNHVQESQREEAARLGGVLSDVASTTAYMERGFHQRAQTLEKKLTTGEEVIAQMNKMASYTDADATQKVINMTKATLSAEQALAEEAFQAINPKTDDYRTRMNQVLASMGAEIDMEDVEAQANRSVQEQLTNQEKILQARAEMEKIIQDANRNAEAEMQSIFEKQQDEIAKISKMTHLTQKERERMMKSVIAKADQERKAVVVRARHQIQSQAKLRERMLRGERSLETLGEQAKRLAVGPPTSNENLAELHASIASGYERIRSKYINTGPKWDPTRGSLEQLHEHTREVAEHSALASFIEEHSQVKDATQEADFPAEPVSGVSASTAARAFHTVALKLRTMAAEHDRQDQGWEQALASMHHV